MTKPGLTLTDNEGPLLALVLRIEPVTTYQIARVYEQSPVTNFNTSRGKLYPLIRRLKQRRLLTAEVVANDLRGTELLYCTEAGRHAVKNWASDIRPGHILLEDPLRTKVQSFDLLTREEQIQWVVEAKAQLSAKLNEVEEYGKEDRVPFQKIVHDNAVSSLRGRMDWLDRILYQLVKSPA